MIAAIAALEKQRGILDPAVVDAAVAELKRQLAATPNSLTTQGERKLVTVMFADMSGFTAMSEAHDAEYVRNLMNDCFEHLVPVVETHGGTIDKFIGDAIMALFGAPTAREDDATRALNAGLEMLQKLADFNRTNGVDLGLHFGINTGEVIAGEIGSAGRRDYSVIGDAVNVAARLQDLSKRGQIFVGPETHRLTRNDFEFETLDALPLKGREAAVQVYRLIDHRNRNLVSDHAPDFDTPMVGRAPELAALVHGATRVSGSGSGSAILIAGEAGVGKSRLVSEARRAIEPDLFWVQGRAHSYAQNASYDTERRILVDLLGGAVEATPAELARMLLDRCQAVLPDAAEETYAHLATIVGLPPDDITLRFTLSVAAETLKPRIARAFLRFVEACGEGKQLALCFEDVHWLDQVSVGLIRHLVQAAAEHGMLLVLTSRPEILADLDLGDEAAGLRTIRLDALDGAMSADLMRNFLRCETIPQDVFRFLHERSEGNPFFSEELLRSLVETGALAVRDGQAFSDETVARVAVPTTLQGVILGRLDRLPATLKATLQTASVIGRSFPLRLLAHVHDAGMADAALLQDRLALLEERGFLRKRDRLDPGQTDRDHVFQHAITQEVVYGSLLETRRARIHRAIAEAIETHFASERGEEYASALALHFRRAGEPRKSAHHYLRAARRAAAAFAYQEARSCYINALGQLDACTDGGDATVGPARAEAHVGQADILRQNGDHVAAREQYETALSLVGDNDAVLLASIYRKNAMSFTSQRMSKEALESSAKANDVLEAMGEPRTAAWWEERIEIQVERLWACYWAGDARLLRHIADTARPEVDLHGSASQRSRYYNGVVLISFREENLNISEQTLACAHYAIELAQLDRDPAVFTRAYFLVACCHMWRGDLASAEAEFNVVLEQLDHTGDAEWRVMTDNYLAVIERKRGNLEGTRRWSHATLDGAVKGRMPLYACLAQANLAWLALREGRLDEAEALASDTLATLRPMPFQVKWLAAWPLVACLVAGDATDRAEEAIRIMLHPEQQRQPAELTEALEQASRALDEGDIATAHARLSAAIPTARALGYS